MQIRDWLWWGGVGILLGTGFVQSALWWGGLLAAVLFIGLLKKAKNIKQLVVGAWFAWFIKYLLALLWFWSTYPIEWLPLQSGVWQLLLIGVYWLTAAFWLSLGVLVVVFGWWLVDRYVPTVPSVYKLCIVPFLWVWAEIFGSALFSLFTLGDGGFINIKFSFGYLGYLLANHQLLVQIASWGGVYVLSIVFLYLAIPLFILWQSKHSKVVFGVVLVVVLGSQSFSVTTLQTEQDDYLVAVVDTDFGPQSLQVNQSQKRETALINAVEVAVAERVDYIILPEDSRLVTGGVVVRSQAAADIQRIVGDNPIVLVDSGQVWRGGESVLQATIYNGHTKKIEITDKRYLVPQGEYTPWLYKSALGLLGQSQIVSYIEDSRGYTIGTQTSQSQFSPTMPGVLFCFESVDPNGVRLITEEHQVVPFIAHIVSHAWFNEPKQLWRQLDAMLQIQAIWNDTYIVSAGNKTTGVLYTPVGTIERQEPVATGEGWQVRLVSIPRS